MYHREIIWDKETHDYAMYLDGELIGFARTYQDAQETLEYLVLQLMSHNIDFKKEVIK